MNFGFELRERIFLFGAVILTSLGVLLIWQSLSIGSFRLIACDVGQGDAQLLITPGGRQVLVDGGPNNKVLDCLSRHMPFWDRKIEVVVNTHPQQDHLFGLIGVLEKYDVGFVVKTPVEHSTELYKTWQSILESAKIKTHNAVKGEIIVVGSVRMEVLWPEKESTQIWKENPPEDLNQSSIVMRVSWMESGITEGTEKSQDGTGIKCIYLTGDITKEIFERLIDRPCDVLKIAHHGSRTGTSEEVVRKAAPKIAIIQAGAKNRYGHPHGEVLELLKKVGVNIYRNDLNGEVEVRSDKWLVTSESKWQGY